MSGSIRAEERRRWTTAEIALVHSDAAFLAEALSQTQCELEQALVREARLQSRVAQLEARCQALTREEEELAAALDEVTAAACRSAAAAPGRRLSLAPARHSRRFRAMTWKASWDEPPDEQDEVTAARVSPPWYARPALWVVAVAVGLGVAALLFGATEARQRQARLQLELPTTSSPVAGLR